MSGFGLTVTPLVVVEVNASAREGALKPFPNEVLKNVFSFTL